MNKSVQAASGEGIKCFDKWDNLMLANTRIQEWYENSV